MRTIFIGFGLAAIVCAHAEFVVAPNDRTTQSGNTFTLDGFRTPSTFQNVYGAANFSQPVLIHGMAFRMEEDRNGLSFDVTIPRVTIRISTYSGSFASFDRFSYDANKGPDDVTAFDSAVRWITTDSGGLGPNPFDLKMQFAQPFLYDPASGALLINYTSSGSFTSGLAADSHGHGDASIGWVGSSLGNLVTQFDVTIIPEPTSLALVIAAIPLLVWVRKLR